jgi:arsenate reductase
MAEGFARALAPPGVTVLSAGTAPRLPLVPMAVEVMREVGIDLEGGGHRPKHVDDVSLDEVDTVVTLCDDAVKECPAFPGKRTIHWSIPDPVHVKEAAEDERRRVFREIRDDIRGRVEALFRSSE